MLDEQLFDALKQVHASDKGSICILKPKSKSDEDRRAFDDLAEMVYELRKRGYVRFNDGKVIKDTQINDYRYSTMACEIRYPGKKALSYENYDAYEKALSKSSASPVVNNNITIVRDAINSNIISGSNNKIK